MDLPFKYSHSANGWGILTMISSFVCALIGVFAIGYSLDQPVAGLVMCRVEGGRAFALGFPVLASAMLLGLAAFPLAAIWFLSLYLSKSRWSCADHLLALIILLPAFPCLISGVHLWMSIALEAAAGFLQSIFSH
jgi:hypothetical protein